MIWAFTILKRRFSMSRQQHFVGCRDQKAARLVAKK